ncbi:helix-hairpin-helix domain-containing protein [Micromonospora sp. CA-111912]|uniref:helix-hairpin-helix domain-containing protein n=1 Tax=Micromonospora sp. CA-111912 TaxID=3239955 RepID=UPI003D8C1EF0
MPSTFGQWLIVILALLLGAAAGWVLRGRQDPPATVTPIVEGDPVAGVAVVSGPTAEATVDTHRPEAIVAPAAAPAAVVDRPAPETAEATRPGAVLADKDPTVFAPADTATTGVPADAEPGPAPASAPAADPSSVDAVTTGTLSADATVDNETPKADPFIDEGRTDDEASPAAPTAPAHTEAAPVEAAHAEAAPVEAAPSQVAPLETTLTEAAPAVTTPAGVAEEPAPVAAPAAEEAPVAAAEEAPVPVAVPAVAGPVVPAPRAAADDAEPTSAVPDDAEPTSAVSGDAEAPGAESRAGVGEASPSAPDAAPVPAPSAGSATADDFRRIQGIGPKMAAALQDAGIRTYRQLADLNEAALRDTIRAAGLRGTPSLATWPQQAAVLAGAPAEADRVLSAPVGADDLS